VVPVAWNELAEFAGWIRGYDAVFDGTVQDGPDNDKNVFQGVA